MKNHYDPVEARRRSSRTRVHLAVGASNKMMESLETGNRLRYPVSNSPARMLCSLAGLTCDSQDTMLHDVPLVVT